MRILIAPVEVSGIAAGLKAGFDSIGVHAQLVLSQPHPFRYAAPVSEALIPRIWARLGRAAMSKPQPRPARLFLLLLWKAWSFCVLIWALARFDAFICMFGNTLTNSRAEAWLLAALRKRVVVIYCGSDSRPPYVDGQIFWDPVANRPETVARIARKLSDRISRNERRGFICVNSPFSGQFHSAPFVSWFAIGVPRAFDAAEFPTDSPGAARAPRSAPLRILHSPSNPMVKGTPRIEEAVEALVARGHSIELVLLRNATNAEVLAEIAKADLIVDQIYSDTPLAGFAIEAARCGKPVLVAGYAASDRLARQIRAVPPPSLFVRPDRLEAALEELVSDPALRRRLGAAAREFVVNDWSAEAVARRYLRLLTEGMPPEWSIDPEAIDYVHGGGLSERDARESVARFVRACGVGALRLDHNPRLREAFVAFAGEEETEARPR